MKTNIFEKDKIRYNLLVELYNQTEGDYRQSQDLIQIGKQLNINPKDVETALYYLLNEGLIESYGAGHITALTHEGIKMVESFLRRIDFNDKSDFSSTELFQLRIILDEIKNEILKLQLGQEVIYNEIDKTFEQSKSKSKNEWKQYFENQIKDWLSQKIIDTSAQFIIQSLLIGLKSST